MAHQLHLEKKKYREWVKAGLALVYLREGLAPFCDVIAKQQHRDILDKIKQTKNLLTVACGQCTLDNLKPDHVKLGNRQCPLHQPNCNCWNPSGKQSCPNKVCDAIHDVIVTNHGSFKPYWKNTDTGQWSTDPWSIAKCFINAPGYENKTSAADIDCTALLHLIVNNKYFHDHIQGDLNMFSKVIEYRNKIFHSSSMELEEKTADTYIKDMIAVLQDGKELGKRQDAQDAVNKLQELMKEDFIITTRIEADVVLAAIESIEKILSEKLENVPTRDEVAGLDTRVDFLYSRIDSVDARVSRLEKDMASVKEDVKKLKSAQMSQQDQYRYIEKKIEFQEKLIKLYRDHLLQVAAIPSLPARNLSNFSEIYVRPRMTCIGQREETEVMSMSDIFTRDRKALESIYVLGDVGAGKSSFCKSLVDYWCLAHCQGQSVNDEFNGVNEMKKFDFLFYISLCYYKNVSSIQEMLEKRYQSEILKTLLEKESAKTLIVLDGLDEWPLPKPVTSNEFQTQGLPERGISITDCTIITTSRPWKVATLGITDREVQKRLKLKGFKRSSVEEMIDKSVPILNNLFNKKKKILDCKLTLKKQSLANITQVPIMLLQLICLWFEDKLGETSKCAVYTGMLELFFSWNDKKETELVLFEKTRKMSEGMTDVKLPQYLIDNKIRSSYKYLIHSIARLAYETLFKKTKEASLTFDSSIFEQLEISDEVKTSCLRLGILSEDKCPSLSAIACQSTDLSFVHKSVQEYLAAVHIAIMFRARVDLSKHTQFIETYFSNCATLDAVLEQENVIIMLCGLEPQIATSVSKYIYDIVNRDARVLEYRRTIYGNDRRSDLIYNIQQCISNSIEEVQACSKRSQFNFYLGDIAYRDSAWYHSSKQYILPDSVRSCTIILSDPHDWLLWEAKKMLENMSQCRRLETIHIQGNIFYYGCLMYKQLIRDIFTDHNVSTLKKLSVHFIDFSSKACFQDSNPVIHHLHNMEHLVALKLNGFSVTHDDFTFLCTFLSGTSHLEQISIDLQCECKKEHEVDLSKHQQLQYLECSSSVIVTLADNSNLEIFEYWSSDKIISVNSRFVYATITDRLISLLSLSQNLRELYLHGFLLTDNIMKSPSEMKSMKFIHLNGVRMRLTTWQKFVDRLPVIPHAVTVEAREMCITREINEMWWRGEEAAAFQYVREQEQLFRVDYGSDKAIQFSTRK